MEEGSVGRIEFGGDEEVMGTTAEDYREFFLGAGEAREIITPVFMWGEEEVAGLVVRLTKEEKGENFM